MRRVPLVRVGLVIALLPIVLAILSSIVSKTPLLDESQVSGGYLWLLIISLPLGFFIIIIGLVRNLFNKKKA